MMRIGSSLMSATILVVAIDTTWLLFRVKRALRAKFPDESLKGVNFYAIMRVLQLRSLRHAQAQGEGRRRAALTLVDPAQPASSDIGP